VDARSISPNTGRAFLASVARLTKFPFRIASDAEGPRPSSSLRVFEDGTALGPAHSLHDEIRSAGAGRYSHWNNDLFFSSSDGSDPRANGRRYVAEAQSQLRTSVSLAFGVAILAAALAGLGRRAGRIYALVALPPGGKVPAPLAAALFLGLSAWPLAWLVQLWTSGEVGGNGFTLGGTYPLTDALMYYTCGASGLMGEPGVPLVFQIGETTIRVLDLCSNRIIYPNIVQTLIAVSGWRPPVALAIQAAAAGFAIACLALWLARKGGLASALLACGLLLHYAFDQVIGIFMTEAVAFPLGIAATVVLLAGATRRHLGLKLLGLALLGLALVARPGALLALPLLVLWLALGERGSWRRAALAGFAAIGALALGPALQGVLAYAAGADAQGSLSNFSLVAYRLSVGARDYSAAYAEHPELFSNAVPLTDAYRTLYRIAIENILAHPEVILGTYAREARTHFATLAGYGMATPVDAVLVALFVLSLANAVLQRKRAEYPLLLALVAGELLSAPVVMGDGGQRVLAATFGARAAMVALCLSALLRLLHGAWSRFTREMPPSASAARPARSPELAGAIALGVVVLAAVLLPFSGALRFARLEAMRAPDCRPPLVPFATRLDRETIALRIVPAGMRRSGEIGVLAKDALDNGVSNQWYADDFRRIPANTTLLLGTNRVDRGARRVNAVGPVILEGAVPARDAAIVGCIDPGTLRKVAGAILPVLLLK
jgi:hypothetical protein